jgi:site-specific DNA-cytosine methylase
MLLEALGVQAASTCVADDKKVYARRFMAQNHSGTLQHIFTEMSEHTRGHGKCAANGHNSCVLVERGAHLATVGSPCQSLSALRYKKGSTPRTSKAELHPDYNTIVYEIPDWLAARNPWGVLLEEVDGFVTVALSDGRTMFDHFRDKTIKMFPGCQVVYLAAEVWHKIARRRVVVALFSAALGGQKAADEWYMRVDDIIKYRLINSPTPALAIAQPALVTVAQAKEHVALLRKGKSAGEEQVQLCSSISRML